MRARHLLICALAALSLGVAACSEEESDKAEEGSGGAQQTESAPAETPDPSASSRAKPKIGKPKGPAPKELVTEDLKKGKGAAAKAGDQLTVNYVGVSYSDGKEFDSSFDSGQPFEFELGASMVIPGWDEGLEGMRVGGRRQLTIPPDKAYGPRGSPPAIGPNETLVFVIDLLAVN